MLESNNQLAIYISEKNYTKNFWETKAFLKLLKPKYVKWQNAWKNRITNYTPCELPDYEDCKVDGIIETWNPKLSKGTSQIKTAKISPMFGPDVVRLYTNANEVHPPSTLVKSADAAENFCTVVALDIRFMVGCDTLGIR